jgi:hypothetical protein
MNSIKYIDFINKLEIDENEYDTIRNLDNVKRIIFKDIDEMWKIDVDKDDDTFIRCEVRDEADDIITLYLNDDGFIKKISFISDCIVKEEYI